MHTLLISGAILPWEVMIAVAVVVSSVRLEQLSSCGSGLQLPSIEHVASIKSAGLKPERHWKIAISPSTYGRLSLACTGTARRKEGHCTQLIIINHNKIDSTMINLLGQISAGLGSHTPSLPACVHWDVSLVLGQYPSKQLYEIIAPSVVSVKGHSLTPAATCGIKQFTII